MSALMLLAGRAAATAALQRLNSATVYRSCWAQLLQRMQTTVCGEVTPATP